jgi:hypothetical protein
LHPFTIFNFSLKPSRFITIITQIPMFNHLPNTSDFLQYFSQQKNYQIAQLRYS